MKFRWVFCYARGIKLRTVVFSYYSSNNAVHSILNNSIITLSLLFAQFAPTFPALSLHFTHTLLAHSPQFSRTDLTPLLQFCLTLNALWTHRNVFDFMEWLWNQHHQTHLEELILFFIKLDPKKTKISLSKKLSQHNSTTKLNIYHKFWIYLYATNINLTKILFNLFSDTN